MKREIEEIKEMLETDAAIFEGRGERVASDYANVVARELGNILGKERD